MTARLEVDLFSDTVTRPTPEMRRFMCDAEVGDEQKFEDPTVNLLQEMVAELLGKTTGAVKALQHRGLASLARLLGLRSPEQPPDRPYPSTDPDRLTSQEEEER